MIGIFSYIALSRHVYRAIADTLSWVDNIQYEVFGYYQSIRDAFMYFFSAVLARV
jgi:hypothetical protein